MSDKQVGGGSDGEAGERVLREIVADVVARFVAEGTERDPVRIADAVMAMAELRPTGRLRYIAAHIHIRDEARNQLREINGSAAPGSQGRERENAAAGAADNVVRFATPQPAKKRKPEPEQLTFWPDKRAKYLQKSYPTRDHVWVPLSEWEQDDWRDHVLVLKSEYEGRGRHIDALIGYGEWKGWKLETDARPAAV